MRVWRPSWPLLSVVTLLRESSLCAFSCHASRPRDIRCIKPSLSFFSAFLFLWKASLKKMFCKCLSLPFCSFSNFSNTFLTSLVRFFSKIKIFMVSFSCFYSHVSCPFSLLMFLSRGSDGRGRNTSPREMSEANGENGQQSLKRRSFVGVFFIMNESLSWWTWINQGECIGWWFLARFGSNSVFVVIEWVVCDTDSSRYTRKWMLIIISLCFLSLSLHFYSLYVYPPSSTLSKKLLERLGNLRRWGWTWRIRWSVSKIKGRRSC